MTKRTVFLKQPNEVLRVAHLHVDSKLVLYCFVRIVVDEPKLDRTIDELHVVDHLHSKASCCCSRPLFFALYEYIPPQSQLRQPLPRSVMALQCRFKVNLLLCPLPPSPSSWHRPARVIVVLNSSSAKEISHLVSYFEMLAIDS